MGSKSSQNIHSVAHRVIFQGFLRQWAICTVVYNFEHQVDLSFWKYVRPVHILINQGNYIPLSCDLQTFKVVIGCTIIGLVKCNILEEMPSSPVAFLSPIRPKCLGILASLTGSNSNSCSGRVIFALIAWILGWSSDERQVELSPMFLATFTKKY